MIPQRQRIAVARACDGSVAATPPIGMRAEERE